MTSRTDTALDQLNHMLHSLVLRNVNRLIGILTKLQSMYTALDHQVQDGLIYSTKVVRLEATNPYD